MEPFPEKPSPEPLSFEKLFLRFEMHDAKIKSLCRRLECTRPSAIAERRIARIESEVDLEFEGIIRIVLSMSRMSAKDATDVRLKAQVVWSLIHDEKPQSIAEVLIHSLCRDLVDA